MRRFITAAMAVLIASGAFAQTIKLGEQLQKLLVAESAISSLYVDEVDDSVLVEAAIQAMLEELDPHSKYLTSQENKEANEDLEGNFDGIGVQFNMAEDTLLVIQTIPDGPSERCGIMAGDRIISAGDTAIAGVGMSDTEVMKYLRGPKGTVVRLGVCRRGVPGTIYFDVTRDKIPLNTVDASYMLDKTTGYIKLSTFGATSVREVEEALAGLQKKGMKSLVLDLQGNGGGYLMSAVGIANEFLEKDNLIVYTDGRADRHSKFTADGTGKFRKGKLVVLIDEYSASASEIVSGALQDWDRATVIGRRSFGKGLVQSPVEFPDGSLIRLTIAKYFTPSGRCIQKPYGDDIDYANDIAERLHRGELVSADSIHFVDSLKYITLVKQRTVYGGGGIMPDIFVPIDTTTTTAWYREAAAHGAMLQAALRYVESNKERLLREYRDLDRFDRKYEVGEDVLDIVLKNAEESGVEYREEEYTKMLPYVTIQLKALIARGLWGMEAYYLIVNRLSTIYCRALEYIAEENGTKK